ncbi:MAG: hypothetical protein KC550_07800, partial [Nanoarchaeota archaeon]|nr:hypothetical protein [Nanoarchaeota archaeon]
IEEALKKLSHTNIDISIRHLIGDEIVFYEKDSEFRENKKNITKEEEEFDFKEIIEEIKTNELILIRNHFFNSLRKLNEDKDYLIIITKKYNYFCKWFAFILQNPRFKLPNGLVFQSVPGVGKDRLIEWVIEKIFGINNVKSIGQDDLGKFNDFVKGVRFVICNEIEFSKSNTNIYHSLKRLMTNKHLAVQGKFKNLENIVNYAHFLFFGNAENIMKIEKGDRRFTVFRQNFKIPRIITKNLSPEMNPGVLEKELENFTKFLYSIKTSFEEIEKPLITAEKEEIMEYHKSDIECFIDNMKEYPDIITAVKNLTNKVEETNLFSKFKNEEIIPNDIIFRLFKLNNIHNQINSNRQERSFQKALTKNGIKSTKSIHNYILNKNTRHRYVKEIFFDNENKFPDNYNLNEITVEGIEGIGD